MRDEYVYSLLLPLQDTKYAAFQAKLIPTLDASAIIGVRTPALRKLAKELKGTPEAEQFLRTLPHEFFEENQLHSFLISEIKDFDEAMQAVSDFLPYVDNWATCDQLAPKAFRGRIDRLFTRCLPWLQSEHPYTVRFAIGMLMAHALGSPFAEYALDVVSIVRSEDYYINMMIAWFYATALTKNYEQALPYLTDFRLIPWTHNKTIQKAIESYRITPEQKDALRLLKIKTK